MNNQYYAALCCKQNKPAHTQAKDACLCHIRKKHLLILKSILIKNKSLYASLCTGCKNAIHYTRKVRLDNYKKTERCDEIIPLRIPTTHICVSKLNIIASDNGLSSCRCQSIIWTNARILFIEPLETNFIEILNQNSFIFIPANAFEAVAGKCRPSFLSLSVLKAVKVTL